MGFMVMRFFRNREIKWLTLLLVAISAGGTTAGFLMLSREAGMLVLFVSGALTLIFLAFTVARYVEISRLAAYLRKVSRRDYTLDIRDNREGELSILKSEIYKVTVMLSQQSEQLKKDKLWLSDCLSDISHQLKTPLTSMFVMTDLLKDENLPADKRKEFSDKLNQQLERLQWLLTSLLKLSRLDSGTVTFRKEQISAKKLVQKSAEGLMIPLELRDQTMRVSGPDMALQCDSRWTSEALVNILKNCIEHTPNGGEIRIRLEDNPLFSSVTVSDNGEGIDRKDLPYIFNRFYKGRNASPDSIGIGLNMARTIIEAQGGSIEVQSRKGEGTRFLIRLYKAVV